MKLQSSEHKYHSLKSELQHVADTTHIISGFDALLPNINSNYTVDQITCRNEIQYYILYVNEPEEKILINRFILGNKFQLIHNGKCSMKNFSTLIYTGCVYVHIFIYTEQKLFIGLRQFNKLLA